MNNLYVGIDPGINNPALVIVEANHVSKPKMIFHRALKLKTAHLPLENRLFILWNDFMDVKAMIEFMIEDNKINETAVYIEYPDYEQSNRGQKAAETGGLGKLILSAGVAFTVFIRLVARSELLKLIRPIQWKGQVPKPVTRKRMEEKYELQEGLLTDDEIDALGLADYAYETIRRKSISPKEVT